MNRLATWESEFINNASIGNLKSFIWRVGGVGVVT